MKKLLAVIALSFVSRTATPAPTVEVTGTALACFPDPNYPVPRPPQCLDSTGLSMYTETGGPNRDLLYRGSTFDQTGVGSFTLDLGTLTLVGAGIRSTINDALHLSINLSDQHGAIGTADYIISVSGFAFYDTMRRQSVGQVSLDFGNPEPQIFDTSSGSYSFTLNTPLIPFLLAIPSGSATDNGQVSYDITGTLTSIDTPGVASRSLVATPEPATISLLAISSAFLAVALFRRKLVLPGAGRFSWTRLTMSRCLDR